MKRGLAVLVVLLVMATPAWLGMPEARSRRSKRPWSAAIRVNGRAIYLARHAMAEEAARAYDRAAREHFGDLARPNFPDEAEPEATP